ncbi:MAG TPA: DUF2510 domain-containing protein [Microbacterium sp.]|uniref:DUF2510 domain-containing protein n=1 Tax=Microbacterium sp. TaxID=51671 RepID=UPI002C642B06|nr:DUF2510 domain-containing protein [Microbacterium sp.]HWI30138.1 DUF2510 domain-containing protein [Microbacterium sp.]
MGNAEPGWYDDGTGRQRWWDGTRWSGHVADLSGPEVELLSEEAPAAKPGWYDDERGRWRWWDGSGWTTKTRFIGEHHSLAGITVSGAWIHFGDASQPIAGVVATYKSSGEIIIDGVQARWHAQADVQQESRARAFVEWVNSVSRHYDERR